MRFMKEVLLEKVVVNMGVGSEPEQMKKSEQIIKMITGKKPIKTSSKQRVPDWGLRPGVDIGLKVTLRKEAANKFLKDAFIAKENKILKQYDIQRKIEQDLEDENYIRDEYDSDSEEDDEN